MRRIARVNGRRRNNKKPAWLRALGRANTPVYFLTGFPDTGPPLHLIYRHETVSSSARSVASFSLCAGIVGNNTNLKTKPPPQGERI